MPDLELPSTLLHRRRSLQVGAGALVPWLLVDLTRPQALETFLWRLLWIFALLLASLVQHPARPRIATLAIQGAAAVSGLVAVMLVRTQAGSYGLPYGFLYALPLATLGLVPGMPSVSLLIGALSTAGGVIVELEEGIPLRHVAEWAAISFTLGGLGVYGTVAYRSLLRREVEAERGRARALEELADSERRRAKVERLAVVGQLAAGVAHEINNPLSSVKANLTWMRSEVGVAAEVVEVVDETMAGIERIASIVGDLRTFALGGPEQLADVSAAEVVDEAIRLVGPQLGDKRVIWHLEDGLPTVRAVRRRLVQALAGLLSNAADAVECADVERRWVRLRVDRCADEIRFAVEDGGPGVPPAIADRVFEPFFTTKGPKVTGLGLALAREHVERCGGWIELGRAHEGGARFTVHLPRPAALPSAAA